MISGRPGFFTRLGNIIIIQVLFIFGALALILFYPVPIEKSDPATLSLRQRLTLAGDAVARLMSEAGGDSPLPGDRHSRFDRLLGVEPNIDYAAVLKVDESGELELEFIYATASAESDEVRDAQAIPEYCDTAMVLVVARSESGSLMEAATGARHSVFYQRLAVDVGSDATVMVTVVDHGLFVSSRSKLQHTILVLFLFATLISLLTVYLAYKRFKQPLDRLIRGLEKTAGGELYYMLEVGGDAELNRLAAAFNRMTQTLWDNQKQLKAYNAKLENSNLSLLESQLFLATLIESSPLGIMVTDSAGQIMIFNRAASEVFGYPAGEVVGKPIELLFAGSPETETEPTECNGGRPGSEVICRRREGELFPAYVVTSPIVTQKADQRANLHILLDITESKSFQDMMIRLDRYCTRGEMAGDIAHEINNYLAVLMGNLELLPLLMKKGDSGKIERKLEVMKDTVDGIARFADGLINSAHDEIHFELSSVNQMVENIVAFLKPQNKFDPIQITTMPSTELPLIQLDQGQIQQVFVNLIYNASEALAGRQGEKQISVSTSVVERGGERFVQVEVHDNGPGVPEDKVDLLFEQRFTTKRKGHGIGLITCRKILDHHNGNINYRLDNGAVFTVLLPVDLVNGRAKDSPALPEAAQVSEH